jgi:DNA (cytosine-5)-methyltransferase 1
MILSILEQARQRFTQDELAEKLDVSTKTISRWESSTLTRIQELALTQLLGEEKISHSNVVSPAPAAFKFIDLFAGIGGTRLGMESIGGKCVWTSEWDKHSQKTYATNFRDEHTIHGDITTADADEIPNFDLLVGGFPCQPFSIAGVSKKNSLGTPHGFECQTQGTLFFEVARIIAAKKPAAFVLENVKNLLRHRKGETFRIIRETLEDELGYEVHFKVIDAKHFVPQHRERIFIVGFQNRTDFSWDKLELPDADRTLADILHSQDGTEKPEPPFTKGSKARVDKKYVLTDKLWDYLQRYAEKHRAKGNGFGFGLVGKDDIARTLSARYYKDGSEILIKRGPRSNPRRLTPRECARLMGFPPTWKIPVSDTQAYRQFGNSVVVPVVEAVAKIVKPHLMQVMNEGNKGRRPKRRRRQRMLVS